MALTYQDRLYLIFGIQTQYLTSERIRAIVTLYVINKRSHWRFLVFFNWIYIGTARYLIDIAIEVLKSIYNATI